MTNMQHYMDDINDLLDGLDGEIGLRFGKLTNWENQMSKLTGEIRILEEYIFDMSKPLQSRTDRLGRLAELKGQLRDLAERKVELADRNQLTLQAVYSKISELAYHCKCEVEIDNPGCTEQRERQFYRSLEPIPAETVVLNTPFPTIASSHKRTREMSSMTDDDRNSTRSVTPFGIEIVKKKVGRPRGNMNRGKHQSSAYSSTRSSVEHDHGRNRKKISKYMRKKQEMLRLEEERARETIDIKKEITENFSYGLAPWGEVQVKPQATVEEEEQDLLDFLLPGFEIEGLSSPPKGMMEALDVTETDLCGMEMYPVGHRPSDTPDSTINTMNCSKNSQSPFNPPTFASISKMTINAATSSSSGELAEKRKRNMLFGSIAETSFSGRPRKLTDRVAEMIQSNREKEVRQKTKRESEEWCYCGGVNTNSEMMVECDRKDCRIGWYHFDCVGLTEVPKDEWYCQECSHFDEQRNSVQFDL